MQMRARKARVSNAAAKLHSYVTCTCHKWCIYMYTHRHLQRVIHRHMQRHRRELDDDAHVDLIHYQL